MRVSRACARLPRLFVCPAPVRVSRACACVPRLCVCPAPVRVTRASACIPRRIDAGLPLTDIYSDGFSILDWSAQVYAMSDATVPRVHSVSYGNDEAQQSSDEYIQEVNAAMMKLGARGLSILFASGDGGVFGRRGSPKRFHAGFPASSPWVTAVGGTDFVTKNVIGEEKAWTGSGGGFSDHFGPPAYQSAAVRAYLTSTNHSLPDQSKWNASGRGFPDVAALGGGQNQYCIVADAAHKSTGAYGTSAATPVLGAVVAKLNELRAAQGKPALGFLNPLLYQNPHVFHDVTQGCNGGKAARCKAGGRGNGFFAAKGWDAATGLVGGSARGCRVHEPTPARYVEIRGAPRWGRWRGLEGRGLVACPAWGACGGLKT